MNIRDLIKISWNSILANKVRAFLTTLGIIIGISAVIAMLSIGQGAQQVILNQVQGLGSNTVSVLPITSFTNRASFQSLNANRLDFDLLKKFGDQTSYPEVELVAGEQNASYPVAYRNVTSQQTVYGVTDNNFQVRDIVALKGKLFDASDQQVNARVAVIGSRTAETLFALDDPIGKKIKINGITFTVVAVSQPKSSATDNRIDIPLSTMSIVLSGSKNVTQILLKADSERSVDSLAIKVEAELRKFYNVKEGKKGTFTVFTSKDVQQLAQTVTSLFTTLLASIASISLVVGGIGIMNIMLVSVSERTKEIGLRKAVGARQSAILGQFLTESVLLTLIGGIIGIIVGISLGLLIGAAGQFAVVLSWESIVLATSVSVFIGIVFGFYPAYRAARLNPIDALRYE